MLVKLTSEYNIVMNYCVPFFSKDIDLALSRSIKHLDYYIFNKLLKDL